MSRLRLRVPLPRRVVMLALPHSVSLEVREVLFKFVAMADVPTGHECAKMLRGETGVCVLFRAPAAGEDVFGAHILQLREQFPNTPFVALFDQEMSDSRWALTLGKSGVAELVVCRRTVPCEALLTALSRCEADSVAVRVWKRAGLKVNDASMAMLKPAIRLAHAPISLARLAVATSMHERSLRKYCEQHALPSPQWIVGWARLMVAAYYLEESGRTIQSIADLLQFPSAVVFSNTTRRYTGKTPSQLRQTGPVEAVSRLLARALTAHSEMLVERTPPPARSA